VGAGVNLDHVHTARLCTACRLDLFYSFRKEGARAGRLAAVIRPAAHAQLRPSPGWPTGPLPD
jgi:copper oxidase (laccase) domain-containing protein